MVFSMGLFSLGFRHLWEVFGQLALSARVRLSARLNRRSGGGVGSSRRRPDTCILCDITLPTAIWILDELAAPVLGVAGPDRYESN